MYEIDVGSLFKRPEVIYSLNGNCRIQLVGSWRYNLLIGVDINILSDLKISTVSTISKN